MAPSLSRPQPRSATLVGAILLAVAALGSALPVRGEEPVHFVGEVTFGTQLYFFEPPFDREELAGFLDQYRYVRNKDPDRGLTSYFIDLLAVDLALARSDGTRRLHLERESYNALNDWGVLRFEEGGLELDVDYRRYRSDSMRLFPIGTGGNEFVPTYGAAYTPDTPFPDFITHDRRFYLRRQSVGGRFALDLEQMGLARAGLRALAITGDQEWRKGYRQDRFLLDEIREPVDSQDLRFRGNRRAVDQRVTDLGGLLVFEPFGQLTAVIDAEFERFREDAPVVTLGDLASQSDDFQPPTPEQADREFRFVPDTNRIAGKIDLSRRFGGSSVHAGGSFTLLEQTGQLSPLQERYDVDPTSLHIGSAHVAFDVPIRERFGVEGFAKYLYRHNRLDTQQAYQPGTIPLLGQESPFMERRQEIRTEIELSAHPASRSRVGLGYRLRFVDRDLDYAETSGIPPDVSLIRERSQSHTAFLRGRAWLVGELRLSGELGLRWAPETAFTRELESEVYFEGRSHYSFFDPCPITLALFGRVSSGSNDDTVLQGDAPDTTRRKGYERLHWGYDVSLSAVPRENVTLFTTFAHQADGQTFDHIRSDRPRSRPVVDFWEDSTPDYASRVLSLAAGGSVAVTPSVLWSVASTFTWSRADFDGTSPTDVALSDVNAIDSRIVSLDTSVEYALAPGFRIGVGYLLLDYVEERGSLPIGGDEMNHTVTLRLSADLGAMWRDLRDGE